MSSVFMSTKSARPQRVADEHEPDGATHETPAAASSVARPTHGLQRLIVVRGDDASFACQIAEDR